jgi:DNA (cytosine-5)-methyltransferase 1
MDWTEHLRLLEGYHTSGSRNGLEYNVVFRLVNAADYGVPQMRHRVIIVGFRSDLDANWSFPETTHSREELLRAKHGDGSYWEEHEIPIRLRPETPSAVYRSILQLEMHFARKSRWQTVRDALKGLPSPLSEPDTAYLNHEYRSGARQYPGHSGSALDEPSKTIKAGAHGVPGGENMMILDNGDLRYYTVRESARMQTYPDDYYFRGSWTESMRQIGNAVPVKLSYIIGDSIAKQLERTNVERCPKTSRA